MVFNDVQFGKDITKKTKEGARNHKDLSFLSKIKEEKDQLELNI